MKTLRERREAGQRRYEEGREQRVQQRERRRQLRKNNRRRGRQERQRKADEQRAAYEKAKSQWPGHPQDAQGYDYSLDYKGRYCGSQQTVDRQGRRVCRYYE